MRRPHQLAAPNGLRIPLRFRGLQQPAAATAAIPAAAIPAAAGHARFAAACLPLDELHLAEHVQVARAEQVAVARQLDRAARATQTAAAWRLQRAASLIERRGDCTSMPVRWTGVGGAVAAAAASSISDIPAAAGNARLATACLLPLSSLALAELPARQHDCAARAKLPPSAQPTRRLTAAAAAPWRLRRAASLIERRGDYTSVPVRWTRVGRRRTRTCTCRCTCYRCRCGGKLAPTWGARLSCTISTLHLSDRLIFKLRRCRSRGSGCRRSR